MTRQFDKSRLPSRHVSVGPERAPHRSYYYAMGIQEEDIAKPFVALASAGNNSAPCNTTLDAQADAAQGGVIRGGGMPRRFNTITVTDGIAMGHQGMKASLVSREVIADSVELSVRGHCYDALVGFAGCDKSLPGMMMAMLRLNVPSIFVYGGSILPGRHHDRDVTVVDVFEAVGQHAAGNCPLHELIALEKVACPGHGACGGQFTANTMACVGEAIGLSLPNSNMMPAPFLDRHGIAEAAGEQVMELVARNIRPRDICTREAFENAARVVAATGGSTNAGLHLPAMANEAGIDFDL
ncbi:dihydroxy-acid dehydratase, partial [Sphingomonas sp. NPDC019816]